MHRGLLMRPRRRRAGPLTYTHSGGASDQNSTTTVVSLALTIPAGACIVVASFAWAGTTSATCTDEAGNTYTLLTSRTANNMRGYLFYCANCIALASQKVTVTFNASNSDKMLDVGYILNADAASPADQSAAASGSSSSPSVTTGSTVQADELVYGALGSSGNTSNVTEDGNFTHITKGGQTNYSFNNAYKTVSAIGTQTYAPTLGTSSTWAALVGTFKRAA